MSYECVTPFLSELVSGGRAQCGNTHSSAQTHMQVVKNCYVSKMSDTNAGARSYHVKNIIFDIIFQVPCFKTLMPQRLIRFVSYGKCVICMI